MNDDYIIIGWEVLGKQIYTREGIPSWWCNDRPLSYSFLHVVYSEWPFVDLDKHAEILKKNVIDVNQFPVDEFPLIEDFEVILLRTLSNRLPDPYEVRFLSSSHGLLVGLRDWEYTVLELCRADFVIPHGDFTRPYFDFDQGWAVMIAEQDKFVYILMGSFEDLLAKKGFRAWFKVERSRYYGQWEQVIQLSRQCARSSKRMDKILLL